MDEHGDSLLQTADQPQTPVQQSGDVPRRGRATKKDAGTNVTSEAAAPETPKKPAKPKSPRTPKPKKAAQGPGGPSSARNPSVKPRKPEKRHLIRWDHDKIELAFLGMVWAASTKGVQLPWDEAAKCVGEHTTGEALKQQLMKRRTGRINRGLEVPPLPSRTINAPQPVRKDPSHFMMSRLSAYPNMKFDYDGSSSDGDLPEASDTDGEYGVSVGKKKRGRKSKTQDKYKVIELDSDDEDTVSEEPPSKKRKVDKVVRFADEPVAAPPRLDNVAMRRLGGPSGTEILEASNQSSTETSDPAPASQASSSAPSTSQTRPSPPMPPANAGSRMRSPSPVPTPVPPSTYVLLRMSGVGTPETQAQWKKGAIGGKAASTYVPQDKILRSQPEVPNSSAPTPSTTPGASANTTLMSAPATVPSTSTSLTTLSSGLQGMNPDLVSSDPIRHNGNPGPIAGSNSSNPKPARTSSTSVGAWEGQPAYGSQIQPSQGYSCGTPIPTATSFSYTGYNMPASGTGYAASGFDHSTHGATNQGSTNGGFVRGFHNTFFVPDGHGRGRIVDQGCFDQVSSSPNLSSQASTHQSTEMGYANDGCSTQGFTDPKIFFGVQQNGLNVAQPSAANLDPTCVTPNMAGFGLQAITATDGVQSQSASLTPQVTAEATTFVPNLSMDDLFDFGPGPVLGNNEDLGTNEWNMPQGDDAWDTSFSQPFFELHEP